ncbi:bacteriohemerythrin [Desulfobotulus sp. H1]|uniref:Bacteriohemerythrin n=1 Tax=Desulfobotulus pelophilus TaxID=2823377 RepID=A0ABT3NCY2_9BACT|nr:bacteriohemerythrin [Desulfobotulus pelophilus]MCW7755314.1 bacteriohemerythrin [Desulfobotulus pelophilus]
MEQMIWDDSLNVRVQNIDEQKRKIVEHINKIYVKHMEKAEPRVLFDLINELGEGLRIHFALEEKIMQQQGYPELVDHRKLHKLFIRKTLNIRRALADSPENVKAESLAYLGEWFLNHIRTDDQRFAPYARIRMFIDTHKRNKRMR